MNIDREITEKVLGWSIHPEGGYQTDYAGMMPPVKEFNPSNNISDAWLVVEKLTEKKGNSFRFCINDGYSSDLYGVTFRCNGKKGECFTAETAPLAICTAALAAL